MPDSQDRAQEKADTQPLDLTRAVDPVQKASTTGDSNCLPTTTPAEQMGQQPEAGSHGQAVPPEESVNTEDLDQAVVANSRRRTRRSFAVAVAAALAGYLLYKRIDDAPPSQMQPGPFRDAFEFNAKLARGLFNDRALAPTYPLSRSENLRVNGVYGLHMALEPDSYRLQVVGVRDSARHARFSPDVTAWEYKYMDTKTAESQGHDTKVPPSARTAEKMAPESMVEEEKKRDAQRTDAPWPRGSRAEPLDVAYRNQRPLAHDGRYPTPSPS